MTATDFGRNKDSNILILLNFDMAAKRRKKHKNKISRLVISMCYNEQKSKFSLFTNPSILMTQ